MKKIGVLALQGAFIEHVQIIEKLGHQAIEVRKSEQLNEVDGLILPGGESTAMGKLLVDFEMKTDLVKRIHDGLPVWGTCAGMILLASELDGDEEPHLKVMDITVRRNAYGRQLDSFIAKEVVHDVSEEPFPLVFIRAPYIVAMKDNVKMIHKVEENIVAVRQDNMLATSFHPELTDNTKFHEYFISMIA